MWNVRSKLAAGIARIAYEPSGSNLADMLTKIQTGPVATKNSVWLRKFSIELF